MTTEENLWIWGHINRIFPIWKTSEKKWTVSGTNGVTEDLTSVSWDSRKERENGTENVFEEVMVENFPNVVNSRRIKKLSESHTE